MTRSNKPLHSIPRFVAFCQSHRYHAERWLCSGDGSGETHTSSTQHVPNLLQGGRNTGPIARTVAGQVVRVLGFYPDLKSRPRHDLQHQYSRHGRGQQQEQQEGFRHDHLDWVHQLQAQLPIIQEELRRVLATPELLLLPSNNNDNDNDENDENGNVSRWTSLRTRRGQEWSDQTGWSHIALVDNFRIQPDNIDIFPETAQLLQDIVGTERRIGPRLVAIAKQEAHSGIPEHCDFMNWMLTLHTALHGPEEGCGIIVNGVARDWTVGDPVVMDTTFLHETYNTSDQDLYLLLVDFWHPDLSIDEIDALRTFFAANSGL
jgi:aspartyl/asparaginyl beta-hydroxylase (cupin superfamily)